MRAAFERELKNELRANGYVEVDPPAPNGGMWTHPDWETATDALGAMIDLMWREREPEIISRSPRSGPSKR